MPIADIAIFEFEISVQEVRISGCTPMVFDMIPYLEPTSTFIGWGTLKCSVFPIRLHCTAI